MTTNTELAELEQLLETTVSELEDTDVSPTGTNVEHDGSELWGYIWLAETPYRTIDERKQVTKETLERVVTDSRTTFPSVVNVNIDDAGENGVAIWWN